MFVLPKYHNSTYLEFICRDKDHRRQLCFGLLISICSFIVFKVFYPYPDFFSDSYSYIFAASKNLDISIWPIGYSKFLSFVHFVTSSDTALVSIQYFAIQLAAAHFYFTVLYYFGIQKLKRKVFFLFVFFNPLTLFLANTINSDAIFAALSLMWLTELIWAVRQPHIRQVFIQAFLLFLCFTIRNNAYYYPAISTFAFILSKRSIQAKCIGILAPFVFLIPFILFTNRASYNLTGIRQYSLFTGWQLANNALYIYDQVAIDSSIFKSPEANELNQISIRLFGQIESNKLRDILDGYVGNFFIREPISPLKQYYSFHYKPRNDLEEIKAWANASKVFESFGKPIILHHPFAYMKYFVAPNVLRYFVPPLSHLGKYDYGGNKIDRIAQLWFNYDQPRVYVFSHTFQGYLLTIYQIVFFLVNMFGIFNMIIFCIRSKFSVKKISSTVAAYYLVISFVLMNFAFSLIATTNILRYQFVPMFVLLAFVLLPLNLKAELQDDRNRKSVGKETYSYQEDEITC